ncbi:hypothetical protein [Arthrobacter koreensis]|uniref:hypothetical protein n=1 Tax=Arthrobacter koreensis TaxID=199136 RepID=UPI0037F3BB98
MAIKKRQPPATSPAPIVRDEQDELARKAEEFGRGGYAPAQPATEDEPDPNAPLTKMVPFRLNEYQKLLLKEAAVEDRRSQQKLLESLVWPELERRRAERKR